MNYEHTTKEETIPKSKQAIIDEAKRIEENCLYTAKGHFAVAHFWTNFHLLIGIPTAILSAIAGTSALSQFDYHYIVAGGLSIIVAALVSLTTFLNPNEKASVHLNSGNNYDSLQTKVRMFWTIECIRENSDQILTEKLRDLSEQRIKLNQTSPQVPAWGYRSAKKGIENGEATYQVDQDRK